MMPRKKTPDDQALSHRVETRVTAAKYQELQELLARCGHLDMSTLIRDILCNRKIKTYVYDRSLDLTMEELIAIRGELKAIGVNINQITRLFNTYPDVQRKALYAKMAFKAYHSIDLKINRLLAVVTKLTLKWLSGSGAENR